MSSASRPLSAAETGGHCVSGHYNQCQVAGGLIGIAVDGGMARTSSPRASPCSKRRPTSTRGRSHRRTARLRSPRLQHGHPRPGRNSAGDRRRTIGSPPNSARPQSNVIVLAAIHQQRPPASSARRSHRRRRRRQQRLKELTDDDAIDVVAECVGGHADTIRQSVDVVRRLGRVIVLGVFAIDNAGFNRSPCWARKSRWSEPSPTAHSEAEHPTTSRRSSPLRLHRGSPLAESPTDTPSMASTTPSPPPSTRAQNQSRSTSPRTPRNDVVGATLVVALPYCFARRAATGAAPTDDCSAVALT